MKLTQQGADKFHKDLKAALRSVEAIEDSGDMSDKDYISRELVEKEDKQKEYDLELKQKSYETRADSSQKQLDIAKERLRNDPRNLNHRQQVANLKQKAHNTKKKAESIQKLRN